MNKEQIIEDMAQSDFCKKLNRHCETCTHCSYYEQAERNYEKGYRKADEVRKDTVIEMCADLMRFLFPDGVCQVDAHNAIEFCDKWYVKAGLKPYNENAIKKYGGEEDQKNG